jgi:hypothetical protein
MRHIALSLRDIYLNKRTGSLFLKRAEVEKYFFSQDGQLVFVRTNLPGERLGEVLFRMEKLPPDAYANMNAYIEPKQSIGGPVRRGSSRAGPRRGPGSPDPRHDLNASAHTLLTATITGRRFRPV